MSETRKCILSAYLVFFISLAVLFVNYDKPPDKGYPLPVINHKIKATECLYVLKEISNN